MAREFSITYNVDAGMDDEKLTILNDTISAASNNNYTINFLEKEKETFVYGFKIKDIPEHDWIWDGQLYFNVTDGYIQFNVGTVQQMDVFINYIISILNSQKIELSIEEE